MDNNENKNTIINTNIENILDSSIINLNNISYGPKETILNTIDSHSLNLTNISNNNYNFNNTSSKITTLETFIKAIDNTEITKSLIEQIKSEDNDNDTNLNNTLNAFNNQSFLKSSIESSLINYNSNIAIINGTLFDISSNNTNQSNSELIENKFNMSNYTLYLAILCPIILIVIICIIYCFIKRKKKSSMNNDEINDLNRIKFKNSAQKIPYNKLQNTSGVNNVSVNPNNISMSEIKVQNLKDEIHDIITNSSGSSSSSGRRKRDKKKNNNNNKIPGYSGQEGNKGVQNNIKEEIKQYVIDENSNK